MFFTIVVFTFGLIMLAIEYLWPRSRFPELQGWYPRAIIINLIGLSTVFIYGTGAQDWIQSHRLWDANELGKYTSIIIGLLIVTFFNYWWHRLRHTLSFFWLWFHQIHHSAQRLEVITTFYKHPFEAIVDTIFTIPIVYLIAGLNNINASIVLMIMGCIELFYHWNIKTPLWLGYIIQRPESHYIHHQEGLHSYNFSDLPIWDILFGTFKNPRTFSKSCGLGRENEQRLKEMLKGTDVLKKQIQSMRND